MREGKIGKVIEEWERQKSEEPDPTKRSFGNAIVKAQYKEDLNQEGKIPEGYSDALARLKTAQSVLTPELIKKYPEAGDIYNKAVTQGVSDRKATLEGIDKSYQLSVPEMKGILGEEGFMSYLQDLGTVSQHMGSVFPGMASVMGTQEEYGNIPLYGLRSALLAQYQGGPRTIEAVKKDINEYSKTYNQPKTGL